MKTDWDSLSQKLFPGEKTFSTRTAMDAFEHIMGKEWCIDLVEKAIEWTPGGELARMILIQLHPWSAQQYCFDCYKKDPYSEHTIELLKVFVNFADRRALPWLFEFLHDSNVEVQSTAASTLDKLIFKAQVSCGEPDVKKLLTLMKKHSNKYVRTMALYLMDKDKIHKKSDKYTNNLYRKIDWENYDW